VSRFDLLAWPHPVPGEFALQIPRKRDDLGDRAVQLFGNAVAQFHSRQQFHQLGVFVDRHFTVAGDAQDFFGQFFVALGGEGRGVVAVVFEGDGLAWSVGIVHAVSSTQRCSRRV
jgi:hypothetical protein